MRFSNSNIINPDKFKIYIVIETSLLKIPLIDFIIQSSEGGAGVFQLRNKGEEGNELFNKALLIRKTIDDMKGEKPYFIVNDRADIAECSSADGVHLGVKDIPPEYIKNKFPRLIAGFSCNNIIDAEKANKWADYAGVGPAFHTSTKKDLRSVLGEEGIRSIVSYLKIPTVAIGGINDKNGEEIIKTGVTGLAVSSYICSSPEPYYAVKKLAAKFND